jgi:hypothetical protein
MTGSAKEIVDEVFRRKRKARRLLAALPIEEKVRRVVALQRRANEVRRATGRREMFEWRLDGRFPACSGS